MTRGEGFMRKVEVVKGGGGSRIRSSMMRRGHTDVSAPSRQETRRGESYSSEAEESVLLVNFIRDPSGPRNTGTAS